MSYPAIVYNVMIASPDDLENERRIAREVLYNWNSLHSEKTGIILEPIGFETHSSPEMGDRPQAIINKQILKNADLLIGIFWSRLGTPTGKSDSGTVEEIQEHIKTGKPTMVYFSNQPVLPSSIDQEQYNKLLAFKKSCKDRGLINEYTTLGEFKDNLLRHLTLTINNNKYFKKKHNAIQTLPTIFEHINQPIIQGRLIEISDEGKELLIEASKSADGRIFKIRTMSGLSISTNNKNFINERNARLEAIWEDAINELVKKGFIEDRGYKGEVFAVTRLGYEYVDRLTKESS